MAERFVFGWLEGGEIVAKEAGDVAGGGCRFFWRLGASAASGRGGGGSGEFDRDWSVEAEGAGSFDDVPLPAEGGEGESLAEEPGVAEIAGCGGVGFAAIDEGEDSFAAAVGDLEKQRAVGFVFVERAEEEEVGGELDFALGVARGFVEVDDSAVVRVGGADGEVDDGGDFFVGRAAGCGVERGAVEDFDAEDAGGGRI